LYKKCIVGGQGLPLYNSSPLLIYYTQEKSKGACLGLIITDMIKRKKSLYRVFWFFGVLCFQEAEGGAPEAAYQPEVFMVLK